MICLQVTSDILPWTLGKVIEPFWSSDISQVKYDSTDQFGALFGDKMTNHGQGTWHLEHSRNL